MIDSQQLRYILLIYITHTYICTTNYIHFQVSVKHDHNVNSNKLDRLVTLKFSIVNSLRYLHKYTQVVFAYVCIDGFPDVFVTFTCNPAWSEIVDKLMPGRWAIDRHDIVSRVFRLKVEILITLIPMAKYLGKCCV